MSPPPPPVLAAFGVAGSVPVRISGGMGTSWRAGDLILKPADAELAELEWQAQLYDGVAGDGFRLARLRRAADGSVCVHGWSATEFVPGLHEPAGGRRSSPSASDSTRRCAPSRGRDSWPHVPPRGP